MAFVVLPAMEAAPVVWVVLASVVLQGTLGVQAALVALEVLAVLVDLEPLEALVA